MDASIPHPPAPHSQSYWKSYLSRNCPLSRVAQLLWYQILDPSINKTTCSYILLYNICQTVFWLKVDKGSRRISLPPVIENNCRSRRIICGSFSSLLDKSITYVKDYIDRNSINMILKRLCLETHLCHILGFSFSSFSCNVLLSSIKYMLLSLLIKSFKSRWIRCNHLCLLGISPHNSKRNYYSR